MSMLFTINNSPFYGKEGKYVSRPHQDRLNLELEKNLALRTADGVKADSTLVFGRGASFRCSSKPCAVEGYELQIGQPNIFQRD